MCWRLEFNRDKSAKNRLTCCRVTLNIIGLSVVLVMGTLGALFATYHAEWFGTMDGVKGDYRYIIKQAKEGRAILLTEENEKQYCNNTSETARMRDQYVFRCGSSNVGQCIPIDNRCDGYKDCTNDESDELACESFCDYAERRDLRFICKVKSGEESANRCFHSSFKCDGEKDCTAASEATDDESSCGDKFTSGRTGLSCSISNDFVCADGSLCVASNRRCNGWEDCHDASDEDNCSPLK